MTDRHDVRTRYEPVLAQAQTPLSNNTGYHPTCHCPDGDMCHYEGTDPMTPMSKHTHDPACVTPEGEAALTRWLEQRIAEHGGIAPEGGTVDDLDELRARLTAAAEEETP